MRKTNYPQLKAARKTLAQKLSVLQKAQSQLSSMHNQRESASAQHDRLDSQGGANPRAVSKMRELSDTIAVCEKRIAELEQGIIPKSAGELIEALQAGYGAYRATLIPMIDGCENRLAKVLTEFYDTPQKAAAAAGQTEKVRYLRAFIRCAWPDSNPVALSRWFLERLDDALAGKLPFPAPTPFDPRSEYKLPISTVSTADLGGERAARQRVLAA